MTDVTILGLGQMGSKLAELLLVSGRSVSVWNRSPRPTQVLAAAGAAAPETATAAIAASPISIVCVSDTAALRQVLALDGAADAVRGRLIVDLGTSGPEEVRETHAWLTARGARHLDGAIQAAPSQMGQPDTPILVAGPAKDVREAEPVLRVLGGNLIHVGEKIDAAAYMDLATLSWVYGSFAGFLHGARVAETVGVDVGAYGRLVQDISPSFGAFFRHEGEVIQSGDFTITESPLRISIPAVARILGTSQALGLDEALPLLLDGWLRRAEAQGLADRELAALIQVLRSPALPSVRRAAEAG
ncbi:NAD(P)-dependent oxidoreductase [Arenibaculum pallidiluteum]|uniref:NAD(P)-dependent oxidoreductase n=1 Tax=Arenibaculum pallidiluteum TaxID=2812559 RepID=UPI001A976309|nr:NAD(P)-binding domain-containing protein [Arenibaculum pallidiluteum]